MRYVDLPQHFLWNARTHQWCSRCTTTRGGQVVARMSQVKADGSELYYLRVLLLHVTGKDAVSWESLKRKPPNGSCATYKEHARQLNLLHDDSETAALLTEAVTVEPRLHKLCELFAEALVWLGVGDAPCLWQHFLDTLKNHHAAIHPCTFFQSVNEILARFSTSLEDFAVPPPPMRHCSRKQTAQLESTRLNCEQKRSEHMRRCCSKLCNSMPNKK
eukprot:7796937-Karenia_brevis.AAC.1